MLLRTSYKFGVVVVLGVGFGAAVQTIPAGAQPRPSPSAPSLTPQSGVATAASTPWRYLTRFTCRNQGELTAEYFERIKTAMNTDGEMRWELVSTNLLPDPQGKPNAMCLFAAFKRPY